MAIEVPQNEEISRGRKNGRRKGVGPAIRWRRVDAATSAAKRRKIFAGCSQQCSYFEFRTPDDCHNEQRFKLNHVVGNVAGGRDEEKQL